MKDDKMKTQKEIRIEKIFKYGIISLVGLLVVSIVLFVVLSSTPSYVAKVGNEKITVGEYKYFLNYSKSIMLSTAGEDVDPEAFWKTKIDGKNALDIAKEKALDLARDQKVLLMKAKEEDIKLTDEEVDSIDENFNQLYERYESKSEAKKVIKDQYGMTINELKQLFKQSELVNKFRSSKMAEIEVTEEEFEQYYNDNPEAFKATQFRDNAKEAVWARHILISTTDIQTGEDLSSEEIKKAGEKADEALEKAKNGGDFVELVKEYSEDPGSASRGGDYVFSKGKMMPEFEEEAFEMEPGQVSGKVKTDYGIHIIKLEERIPEKQPVSLRCAREYYEFGDDLLLNEKFQEKMETWRKDYEIKINDSIYDEI